jgi:ABC-type sugar transport system substrate-binding protein
MQARFKRVVLAAAIIAAFGTMLAYVGLASGAGKIQIAEFYYNPSPYGIASYKAAVTEGNKLGAQVTTFDGNNVPQTQTTQMTDAITTGKYKGFWVWALDGVSAEPTIKAAEAKGIKVAIADYTLGDLNAELQLNPTPGLVSTIGQPIQGENVALVTVIKAACAKAVGVGKPCNVAFMPGLANYPTDTIRIDYMQKAFATGPIKFNLTPIGDYDQPTSQKVALTYFQSKPNIQVFGSFGDQMTQGAITAFKQLGIVPGKNIQVFGYGGTNELLAEVKAGTVFATLGLYPAYESTVGIKDLVAAIQGKKVPDLVNVINKHHPIILNAAFLKSNPNYKPDWDLSGNPG